MDSFLSYSYGRDLDSNSRWFTMSSSRLEGVEKYSPSGADYSMMRKSYHNFHGCHKAYFPEEHFRKNMISGKY